MGGIDSYAFKQFEELFVRGFFALQKHIDGLITIIQLYYGDRKKGGIDSLKSRYLYIVSLLFKIYIQNYINRLIG